MTMRGQLKLSVAKLQRFDLWDKGKFKSKSRVILERKDGYEKVFVNIVVRRSNLIEDVWVSAVSWASDDKENML